MQPEYRTENIVRYAVVKERMHLSVLIVGLIFGKIQHIESMLKYDIQY